MKIVKLVVVALALLSAYLLLWPVDIRPQAWDPPAAPSLKDGSYAYNEKLKGIERLADGFGTGPEGITIDPLGRLYAGYLDGRVVRLSGDGASRTVLGDTGGRPLGIGLTPDGRLFLADARKGLMQISEGKSLVISDAAEGKAFGFPDDVVATRGGRYLYFTDASSRFGYGHHVEDALEHGASGRVLLYDTETHETKTVISGLHFANGVALGPNDDYLLINETSEYRVRRYWIHGPKAGTVDTFIDNLPGFPDNISFNGKDRFWIAIFAPRDPLLDKLLPAGNEWLREVVARLPAFLQPKPRHYAMALGVDTEGKLVANLQYEGADAYGPITSVREHGDWLYFGSLTDTALGRLPLQQALPAAGG